MSCGYFENISVIPTLLHIFFSLQAISEAFYNSLFLYNLLWHSFPDPQLHLLYNFKNDKDRQFKVETLDLRIVKVIWLNDLRTSKVVFVVI